MKKKIKHLFFALVVIASLFVILPIESNAATNGTCGDNLTWTLDDSGILTISGTGEMEKGDNSSFPWYSLSSSIKSVVINDGITSIGDEAFRGCTGLTSITIPNSVTSIGCLAFYGCTGLTSVSIPSSVTGIDSSTFYGCTGLTSINIPNSVTSIGSYAFYGCTGLKSVSVKNTVTSIGRSAFSSCTGLEEIYWDTNIIDDCLYNQFFGNAGISGSGVNVIFGDNIEKIPDFMFESGNDKIVSVTIGKNVASIGRAAFRNCSGLTSINISDSVTSIGNDAFDGCTDLAHVYYTGAEEDWDNIYIGYANSYLLHAKRIYLECTKTTVSADGTSFTVTPKNIENDNTVILALYSGNVFLGLQSEVYKGKDIPFTTSEAYTKAKVMVWNGFDKMTPISEVEKVK